MSLSLRYTWRIRDGQLALMLQQKHGRACAILDWAHPGAHKPNELGGAHQIPAARPFCTSPAVPLAVPSWSVRSLAHQESFFMESDIAFWGHGPHHSWFEAFFPCLDQFQAHPWHTSDFWYTATSLCTCSLWYPNWWYYSFVLEPPHQAVAHIW